MKKVLLMTAILLWSGLQIAMAQSRPIKGQVLDEKGEGVPGASVQVKNGKGGTVTDADGNFSLDVPDGNDVLVIKGVGLAEQEVKAGDGINALNVKLSAKDNLLDETVVVGYGTETKKGLIGGASIVKAEAFDNKPYGSFTNMLQGKATGVQVTGSDGAPGSNANITIRGIGGIGASSSPLFVIDGVPATVEAYRSLNPEDIENVSILKDASTTAIYGSRGSSGIIMVTTKKGKRGMAPQVSLGFEYGFRSKTNDNFKMMNFDQKLQYEKDLGFTNKYLQPLLKKDGLNSIVDAPDASFYWNQLRPYETNWMNELLRTGRVSQADLSIRGGSENTSYSFSFQNYSDDGTSAGSNFVRRTGGLSVETNVNKWLKIGEVASIAYTKTANLRDIYNSQNPFIAMYSYQPYEAPYNFGTGGINGYNLTTKNFNVIEGIQNNPASAGTLYGRSASYIEVNPIKGLTLRSQIGLQYATYKRQAFTEPGSILDLKINGSPLGTKTDNGAAKFNFVWSNTAEYKRTFGDVHNFKVLLGTEYTNEDSTSYSLQSKGYPLNPNLNTQNNGAKPNSTSTGASSWALVSYFARAEYNYKGKYFLNGSVRTDGSSVFGTNTRYGTFGAIGAAWDITQEGFFHKNSTLNFLKIWASVGTSGNNSIGAYRHLASYTYTAYSNSSAVVPDPYNPGNEDLTWEKNTNGSIGADFVMFNNRLTGNFDYYKRHTHSLILDKPISSTTGYSSQTTNLGGMNNSGVELQLNYDVIRTKDLLLSVGGNVTYNKNKVTALKDEQPLLDDGAVYAAFKIGQPYDVYFMPKSAGIDPTNGEELWYKQDGTKTNDYSQVGNFYLDGKSSQPTYFGGFYTNVNYKGIGLGVDFYYSGGGYTYNALWEQFHDNSGVGISNLATDLLNHWSPAHTDALYPLADRNIKAYDSDRWLQKTNYMRLRNIILSYDFPPNILKRIKMQGLRFYVQGSNLWYHASEFKGDPEVGAGGKESGYVHTGNIALSAYPQTKAVTCGVKVTF